MYIKSSTVIPAGVKITKLPPSKKNVKSLFSLLKAEERRLTQEAEMKVKVQMLGAALKAGYTVLEAIKFIG